MTLPAQFPDDRLEPLFVCAHPAIDSSMHTPLMLQTVLGLDAARIAHAFLGSTMTTGAAPGACQDEDTVDGGIQFEVPQERSNCRKRLDAVLGSDLCRLWYWLGRYGGRGSERPGTGRGSDLARDASPLQLMAEGSGRVRGLLALMSSL